MTQIPLTPEQQRFVSSPPVAALRLELWRWAARPIGVAELLRDIERYERTRLPSDARRLAVDCQDLSASPVRGPASTGRPGRYALSQRQRPLLGRRRSCSTI